VAATLLGKRLGTALFGRVSQGTFRAIALTTVALTGAMGVATAIRALAGG